MIMAKKATNKKDNLPMEEVLWKACDVMRCVVLLNRANTNTLSCH